ncbi:TetR/AcrR family transcriptional regulator [Bifidobacterium asteroides]|uniref:TetR/AcrR family transcriptional regulator n=1 Tax=Bifidobacterium asteroides TaxID=1684 RepID=UPI0015E88575|nr:TetR/AcrR family transcriptional regulator [Bifidobacterium asteroides]
MGADSKTSSTGVPLPSDYQYSESSKKASFTVEERKEQILDAATHIIGKNGFWGFTVRQVAEACNLTEPAILYHFKNKEKLLVAVLSRRDDIDLHNMASELHVGLDRLWADPTEFGLWDLCLAAVQKNSKQPEIVRLYTIMQGESLNSEHPAYAYFQNRERWATSLFARAAKHDGYDDPARIAQLVLSEMDGMQIRWLRDLGHFDLVESWKAFRERFA